MVSYKKLQQIEEFKEIEIKNNEVNLSGWFWNIQNKNEKVPLVIFFTGNAQNSSNTLYNYYLSETDEKIKKVSMIEYKKNNIFERIKNFIMKILRIG